MRNCLFIILLFLFGNIYCQTDTTFTLIDSPEEQIIGYAIVFEGRYTNEKVKIFSDDSLVYQGIITAKNPDVLAVAGSVSLNSSPKKLKIIIGHKKISFKCNPAKPYLYNKKIRLWGYSVKDSNIQKRYR